MTTPTPEQLAKLPKWAKDHIESLKRDAALRWPTEPEPVPVDVRSILSDRLYGTLYVGWHSHSWEGNFRVGKGCSSGSLHSTNKIDKTDSQGCGRFFESEEEALLSARWEMCRRFAKSLALLDAQLERSRSCE